MVIYTESQIEAGADVCLTCAPTRELGFVITQPNGTIAAFLITSIFTILLPIAAPHLRNAVSIRKALKFISMASSRRMDLFEVKREEGTRGEKLEFYLIAFSFFFFFLPFLGFVRLIEYLFGIYCLLAIISLR